ncbi:mastermind-like protein 1 [Lingula anatina]|uniref:Mastermind-like protein 1 n=1 Tax=Lingula anatina TaxID=7574 RepID=A0A1S3HZ52_LINAN|nr:mastermind-like protein 1 [Lingula anatina]|eukprot:XP_013390851.1 mastermind-like protein 1 [Lingula anatina]
MGDFFPPKRKDVVDRLRRRIEFYRRHQNGTYTRYQNNFQELTEHIHKDTEVYHQKWLDSRTKKASKHSRVSRDSSDSSRQVANTQKLKRKLEGNNGGENIDSGYHCDQAASPQAKHSRPSTATQNSVGSLSVQVQIKSHSEHPQNSQTDLTVSATVRTHAGALNDGTNVHTSTSVDCKQPKQEPIEEQSCSPPLDGTDVNVDELQDILDTLAKEEGEGIPPELMKEIPADILKDFDIITHCADAKDKSPGGSTYSNNGMMYGGATQSMHPPQFPDGQQGTPGPIFDQHMNPMNSVPSGPPMPAATNAYRQQPQHLPHTPNTGGPPPSLLDTGGPAAETLKQMAAQHQSSGGGYPNMAAKPPYAEQHEMQYSRGAYPGYPQSAMPYNQQGVYPYSQQVPRAGPGEVEVHRQQLPPGHPMAGGMQDPSLSYAGTKPLSHYSPDMMNGMPPSSLRQLQNQFGPASSQGQALPGNSLQITQSQNMEVMQGSQRMQVSQTQHMNINAGQGTPISMAQRQSFNIAAQHAQNNAQYNMNEQHMRMQQQQQHAHMMQAKMRQEEQQKREMEQQRQHQQQQQQQAAHMQYLNNRPPPPEYKMHPGSAPPHSAAAAAAAYQASMGSSNPLQTMQNMVNQTSVNQSAGFGPVKSENLPGTPGTVGPPGIQAGYSAGMQRQQSYPGAPGSQSAYNQPSKPSTPTYTSPLMRNERPPNVNVGPAGLNISEQRTPNWGRSQSQGPHYPGMARPPQQMTPHSMMQYGSFAAQNGTYSTAGSTGGMQAQRAMMSGGIPPGSLPPGAAQENAMMQHNIHMQQQQMMMAGGVPQQGPPGRNYQNGGYPLDNSGDLFDSVNTQGTELSILDQILG